MKITKKITILAVMTVFLGAGAYKVWALQRHEDQAEQPKLKFAQLEHPMLQPEVLGAHQQAAEQSEAKPLPASMMDFQIQHGPKIKGTVPVLMYHYVGDLPQNADALRTDLSVSNADFEAQMTELQSKGFHSITTAELYANLTDGTALPSKPVMISFDDGYQDAFDNAVPILEKHGYVGVFAIITNAVGKPNYAGWQEIASAKAAGMDIVSHTMNHIDMTAPKYTPAELQDELSGSAQAIKENLGFTPTAFVFPYGRHNATDEEYLKQAGYKIAFTTAFGFAGKGQDLLALPRVRVHGHETMEKFERDLEILPPKSESGTQSQTGVKSDNTNPVKTP